ncbi:MAG: hypothetical protein ACODAJ_16985 [Planctomycetota bacterium]
MPYAIVQKSLERPPVEGLARAFQALPQLTDYDAASMAKDAYGILVQGLELADAGRLLQAMFAQGIEADMVDQGSLPPLPPPKPCRRAEPRPEHLVACDHLGRPQTFAWDDVILLAAGGVRDTEFKHVVKERVIRRHRGTYGGYSEEVRYEHDDKPQEVVEMTLEIFLDVAPARLRIEARRFNFAYLGDRLHDSRPRNYAALVADTLRQAAGAVLNRGAERLQREPGKLVTYPSKHAFEEEIVWLLWRHFVAGKQGAQGKDA